MAIADLLERVPRAVASARGEPAMITRTDTMNVPILMLGRKWLAPADSLVWRGAIPAGVAVVPVKRFATSHLTGRMEAVPKRRHKWGLEPVLLGDAAPGERVLLLHIVWDLLHLRVVEVAR